jgi:uncharacterized protein YjbI with pentapeptide repeats
VNLTRVILDGADLSGADLRRAYLRGADLVYADLTDTQLDGANLTGADLDGTRWSEGAASPEGWTRDSQGRLRLTRT